MASAASTDDCGGGDQDCDGKVDEDCVGPASLAPICGEGQSAPPGGEVFETLTVKVLDKDGNPVPGAEVVWTAPLGGSLASPLTTANALGLATNQFTVGGDDGKDYIAHATAKGGLLTLDIKAHADAKLDKALFSYVGFCAITKLKWHGPVSFDPGKLSFLTNTDSESASLWSANPTKEGSSFRSYAEVSGFSAAYRFVVQAAAKGTNVTGGGYGDGNTPKLTPAFVAQIKGSKGGGQVGPATLTIYVDGVQVGQAENFLAQNVNDTPRSLWFDFDAPSKTLRVFQAPIGDAKPAKAAFELVTDLWKGMLAGSAPVYVGMTFGNASAGVRGVKGLETWRFGYNDAPCFTESLGCDDDNDCTNDVCDQALGCQHTPADKPCDDGSACTDKDVCVEGVCKGGKSVDCDDGNACTNDSCDKALGCIHAPNNKPCDDGQLCTVNDACKGAACAAGAQDACDDGYACSIDACNETIGCQHTKVDKTCEDGQPCTKDSCVGALGGEADTGCKHVPLPNGFSAGCYTGDAKTRDVGTCKSGITICNGNGGGSTCTGEILPKATDPCANGDEDCDGLVNEDCDLAYKIGVLCDGNQSAPPGGKLFMLHRVLVTDGNNTPQGNVTVLWTSPDGGAYESATSKSDGNGIATGRFIVGNTSGKTYTGVATIEGTTFATNLSGKADGSMLDTVVNYPNFCDTSALKLTGVAAIEGTAIRVVTGGDGQQGSFWYTGQLAAHKGKSFQVRYDVAGYSPGYGFVIQSGNAGTSQGAGGYGDGGTPKLNPALVIEVTGGKGGGAYSPPNMGIYKNGGTVGTKGSFLGTNQNSAPYTYWIDYDATGKKLSVFTAPKNSAKPSTALLAVDLDVWAGLGDNGKPIYTGFTSANASAGSNGTSYITRWEFTSF